MSSWPSDKTCPPFTLELELVRACDSSKPDRVARDEWNRYLLRDPDNSGHYAEGELCWDSSMRADLSATADPAKAERAIADLTDAMARLVAGAGWKQITDRIEAARAQKRAVAITVRSAADELYTLPWECLDVAGTPLYQTHDCLLRYQYSGPASVQRPKCPPPSRRIVVAWAGAVPAEQHVQAIAAAARAGHVPLARSRDVVETTSLARLGQVLDQAPATILHILCHGEPLGAGKAYGLRLSGSDEPVTPAEIGALLERYAGSLRLVVVAACMGANPGALDNELGSVARAIHRAGVPAVIASRYPLSMSGSVELTRVLYHDLLVAQRSLEQAFVAARAALFARPRQPEEPGHVDAMAVQLVGGDPAASDFRPWIFRAYRGLKAYYRKDARLYFGREQDRQNLLDRMDRNLSSETPRFLLVAGESGTGKSSLVCAGLIGDLEDGKLAARPSWAGRVLRPCEIAESTTILDQLVAEHQRSQPPGTGLALVIDQLEELFTEFSEQGRREEILRALWRLASEPDGAVFVLATIRIDYMGRLGTLCMNDGGLPFDRKIFSSRHSYIVPQLAASEYEQIIRGPAEAVGIHIEPGLLERLLDALRAEPGALPLLSFTLDRLWQQRCFKSQEISLSPRSGDGTVPGLDTPGEPIHVTGWWLTDDAYDALGGIAGALVRSADEVYHHPRLTDDHRREIQRVLVQLVSGREDPMLATRRRGLRQALRPDGETARFFDEALDRLIDARLLVQGAASPDAPVWIELAHDSLIRLWPRLRTWYTEARSWLARSDELGVMADAWKKHTTSSTDKTSRQREDAYLLYGDRLRDEYALWQLHRHQLGAERQEFIDSFFAACKRGEAARRARRLEQLIMRVCVAALLVLMVGWGGWMVHNKVDTDRASVAARDASIMVGVHELLAKNQRAMAGKLLDEITDPRKARGWRALAWDVLSSGSLAATLRAPEDTTLYIAGFDGEGKHVLTTARDGVVRLWRTDGDGDPIVLSDSYGTITAAAFSKDGMHVAAGTADGAVLLWRMNDIVPEMRLIAHHSVVRSLMFSSDGKLLLTASTDATARIWRVTDGTPMAVLRGHTGAIGHAEFSSDDHHVVTASDDKTARVWQVEDGSELLRLAHDGIVLSARFSPDGRYVVTASQDATARVWSITDATAPRALLRHKDIVSTVAFSRDGKRVITASHDHTARLWDVDDPGHGVSLPDHEGAVLAAVFSPDGKMLITASSDGTARVWRITAGVSVLAVLPHDRAVHAAEFSPDGRSVVTAAGNTVRVWHVDDPAIVLRGHENDVTGASFSPDGKLVVTASSDRTARLWRVTDGAPLAVLGPHDGPVTAAMFGPDGKSAATVSPDASVRLWRIDRAHGSASPFALVSFRGEMAGMSLAPWLSVLGWVKRDDAEARDDEEQPTVLASPEVRDQMNGILDDTPAATLGGPMQRVTKVAFSPDDDLVALAFADGTTQVLGREADQVALLHGHEWEITSLAFSPDGRFLVTTSVDNTARLWTMDVEMLKARLHDANSDCLPPFLRRRYLKESDEEAVAAYEACERSHSRTAHELPWAHGPSHDIEQRSASRRAGIWAPQSSLWEDGLQAK